ncbi:16S rRNA (uracil1498-N3)-methyltransferase [Desulfomicrobium apsheronum]|uniref:Ribosomal RNA small subunit methyltransferase E n=1 Tax=Desulfomicrobium apsheronum TaxID=52560 RepID=A0A1I3QLP4_9BACT|nr:16S rRNA (uracil(1498)-N(3))-methyltransferase [Desulfomicrobium apsheronum]SFJ34452.1 16S rRNA (uracil1498-N3)-methyltransferase [Desulfomicrobium apsheronum]
MSRLNSFYLAPVLWREPFLLEGEEFHHLTRVLRAKAGETVRLFDGQGRWGLFRIDRIDKRDAGLNLIEEYAVPAPASPLTLAVGWSKGLRRGFLLEKAVELGASAIWFWQAARSQGDIPEEGKQGWDRQLAAAAKQCGAVWLPGIRTFRGPLEVARAAGDMGSRVLCWEKEDARLMDPEALMDSRGSVAVLGPEGGLDDKEARLFLDHGFTPVSLGPSILRFETAATFVLSLHLWAASRK